MSHLILPNDRQEGIEMAWHNLTVIRPDLSLTKNWLAEHDVNPLGVYAGGTLQEVTLPDGSRAMALVGATETNQRILNSDGAIIGGSYDPNTYTPIRNADILETIKNSLDGVPHEVVSVGTYRGRSSVSVTVKLANMPDFIAGKRSHKTFLNFLSSHDQTVPFRVSTSNICVVCANTFGWALRDLPMATVRHNKNALSKLPDMARTIDAAVGVQAEFAAAMNEFDGIAFKEDNARRLFAGFVAPKDAEQLSTRAMNTVERLTGLYRGGAGNSGETLADAFSAFTDYYSHESSGGDNRAKQYVSSEFGTGATRKREAFEICRNRNGELESTIARGEKLLLAS